MAASLSTWPWENFGIYKYLLYGPLVAKVLYSYLYEDIQKDMWCLHILLICTLRAAMFQLWCSVCNMYFLTKNRRIVQQCPDFNQIDREWNWENFLILHAWIAFMACYMFPSLTEIPTWNSKGLIYAVILHVLVSEPLYYWIHRQFHSDYLFTHYHSLHHSIKAPTAYTAGYATPLEHLVLNVIMGIPVLGASLMGAGSISLIYGYVLIFDALRCMGLCNVEVIPHQIFRLFPFLKYLIYTATYHSLHRAEMNTNFCLFMPIYDALGRTLNTKSWELHKKISTGLNWKVPDFVFLCHVVDITSSMHAPFLYRSLTSMPFKMMLAYLPYWPIAFMVMLAMWIKSRPFIVSFYSLKGFLQNTWSVPRYGFQYFIPFALDGINRQIEHAILDADRLGVKVISLAALNKNEALNGGGTLFVEKHPNLRVRVVHGNTLTAAVILNEIGKDVKEVFLTGATSKLGRAIALYLCRKGVRVLVSTSY